MPWLCRDLWPNSRGERRKEAIHVQPQVKFSSALHHRFFAHFMQESKTCIVRSKRCTVMDTRHDDPPHAPMLMSKSRLIMQSSNLTKLTNTVLFFLGDTDYNMRFFCHLTLRQSN